MKLKLKLSSMVCISQLANSSTQQKCENDQKLDTIIQLKVALQTKNITCHMEPFYTIPIPLEKRNAFSSSAVHVKLSEAIIPSFVISVAIVSKLNFES